MTDSLGLQLSKVLFAHEPGLLVCDMNASARAAGQIANLLGCILATVLQKGGDAAYEQAFRAVALKIHRSACSTSDKAERQIPNVTPH